jgi:F-type H+-transporting ATPase subunit b
VIRFLALLLLLSTGAAPALAETGGEHDIMKDLVHPAVNLLLLLAVIGYFARKPILGFFAERRSEIQGELRRTAELKAEAEARYAEWQRRLTELDAELESIRATARERAEAERERIRTDAEAAAERIRADARAAVQQELRRARERLREEAAELAIEIAAQRLAEGLTPADRDRLLDEFVGRIEHVSDAPGPGGAEGR